MKRRSGGLIVAVLVFKTVTTTTQLWKEATLCELKCSAETEAVFWAEVWRRVGRTYKSYKLPKTLPVTTLVLFGHVMLLLTFLSFLRLPSPRRLVHSHRCQFCLHKRCSEISQLAASETFTQWRRMRRIGAWSHTERTAWMRLMEAYGRKSFWVGPLPKIYFKSCHSPWVLQILSLSLGAWFTPATTGNVHLFMDRKLV